MLYLRTPYTMLCVPSYSRITCVWGFSKPSLSSHVLRQRSRNDQHRVTPEVFKGQHREVGLAVKLLLEGSRVGACYRTQDNGGHVLYIRAYVNIFSCVCMYIHVHILDICLCKLSCAYMPLFLFALLGSVCKQKDGQCICVCMLMYAYVCLYIHTSIQT